MLHSRTIPPRNTGYIGWLRISRYSLPPSPLNIQLQCTSKLKFINHILQISQFEKGNVLKKSLIPDDIHVHVYSLNAFKEKLILRLTLSCL